MFQLTAFKENGFAPGRIDFLGSFSGMMDGKLSAVAGNPVCVEVNDHGVLPAGVVAELVDMFFVKTPRFIQSVMEFITIDTGVAGTVQVQDEGVHQRKKGVFVDVVMFFVQPVNDVAAHGFVVRNQLAVTDAGGLHLPAFT